MNRPLGYWLIALLLMCLADLHVLAHGWGTGGRTHAVLSWCGVVMMFVSLTESLFGDRKS